MNKETKTWGKWQNIEVFYVITASGKKANLLQRRIRGDGKVKFRSVFISHIELGEQLHYDLINN